MSFYSLRKNAMAALVHQSEVAQIVGHERGLTFSVHSPLGLDLPGLSAIAEKIVYPGLKPAEWCRMMEARGG